MARATPRATSSLITETALRPDATALRRDARCAGMHCDRMQGRCHLYRPVAHLSRARSLGCICGRFSSQSYPNSMRLMSAAISTCEAPFCGFAGPVSLNARFYGRPTPIDLRWASATYSSGLPASNLPADNWCFHWLCQTEELHEPIAAAAR